MTFTATVTGVNPSGTVTFKDGATTLGTGTLGGSGNSRTATLAISTLSVASHSITASYGGDASNNLSTSAALAQAVVNATTTTVASSANPSVSGASVSFTATVSGVNPTGRSWELPLPDRLTPISTASSRSPLPTAPAAKA